MSDARENGASGGDALGEAGTAEVPPDPSAWPGSAASAAAGGADEAGPLFFRRLETLDAPRHADLCLTGRTDYRFARDSHMIPLNGVEFMAAARHYPILFNGDASNMPVVLVGVRAAQNLFVEPDGSWTEGCYIPAFVRRYPFTLLRGEAGADRRAAAGDKGARVRLGIDRDAPQLDANGRGTPLFNEDGTPSAMLRRMGRFVGAFAREQARTRRFVDACREHELLVERAVDVQLAGGRHMAIRGFRVVDEERLRNMPAEHMETWWRQGWFSLAVAHLVSLGNFGRLFMKDGRAADTPINFRAD